MRRAAHEKGLWIMDFVFIGLGLAFFGLTVGLVEYCDRLMGNKS